MPIYNKNYENSARMRCTIVQTVAKSFLSSIRFSKVYTLNSWRMCCSNTVSHNMLLWLDFSSGTQTFFHWQATPASPTATCKRSCMCWSHVRWLRIFARHITLLLGVNKSIMRPSFVLKIQCIKYFPVMINVDMSMFV